ncbi:2-C-methyl-D-erythritol 2,4-cyclodiphosphate synthase [filamentous cyanobacterium CCP4]|nr:2-C-methyl-D-erythritol 2,4-cyclodiphosphate synthase [filamentous cyanobacterium CCP4]
MSSRTSALRYYVLTRLLLAPLMIWTITTVVFLLLRATPGDPVDALLGALSLGDIGLYFPPGDPEWAGADSLKLLVQVNAMVQERGWQVSNIDSVVVAEQPKLKPHIDAMRSRLADKLGLAPNQVGVKATTNEKLGPVGRQEGIAAYAVALLTTAG